MTDLTTRLALIDAVVARLQVRLPDLAVEYFPENPTTYRLNHPKGALLVQYLRSQFGPQEDCSLVVQARKPTVTIIVIARQVNGRDGAVAILDRIEQEMLGWEPPGWMPFIMADDRFMWEKAGLWAYAINAQSETQIVQVISIADGPAAESFQFEES